MIKFVYKLVSLLVSVLGGILAGAIFKQVRKLAAREEEPPTATDDRHRAGGSGPGRCPQARASAERLNR